MARVESGTSYTERLPPAGLVRNDFNSDHVGSMERRSANTVLVGRVVDVVGKVPTEMTGEEGGDEGDDEGEDIVRKGKERIKINLER